MDHKINIYATDSLSAFSAQKAINGFLDEIGMNGLQKLWSLYKNDITIKALVNTIVGMSFKNEKMHEINVKINEPTAPVFLFEMVDKLKANGIRKLWEKYSNDAEIKRQVKSKIAA